MNNPFPINLLKEQMDSCKFTYHMVVDCYDEQVSAYILYRVDDKNKFELMLSKVLRKDSFEDEVKNLCKYFNAEIPEILCI